MVKHGIKGLFAALVVLVTVFVLTSHAADADVRLDYSTYLGGSGSETARAMAVDDTGAAYVMGYTSSTDFPTTEGAYQTSRADPANYFDIFVTKFSAHGSMVYSTYVGGTYYDYGYGMALGSDGSAYVAGYTQSTDFPAVNPYQASYNNNRDSFVFRLSPDGSSLVYSTYLGGSSDDRGYAMAVGSDGSAYITGWTQSDDFPTENPYQAARAGSYEGFVTRLAPSGSSLIYSTYLGGTSVDYGYGIAVGSDGSAYVTGSTQCTDFPTTANAYQSSLAGIVDAFVARLSADGSNLVYGTYLGGSTSGETGYAIALGSDGSAYVTGYTKSDDFPTMNPYQAARAGDDDVFVARLSADGSNLVYGTYLGGSGEDDGYGIAVDGDGMAYITGRTLSNDFPTMHAYQAAGAGSEDAFVARLASTGPDRLYSTYLGGNDTDYGYGIAIDAHGAAYVAGYTESGDFPTKSAYQSTCGGSRDAFVSKLLFSPAPPARAMPQVRYLLWDEPESTSRRR
ncbi:MAG: SBBP repeat-containing protein [Thermodesulfobacteriota bacterium]|nr:SBBP repeat-containing protein [Thermodesulfobacteriota bacterium]